MSQVAYYKNYNSYNIAACVWRRKPRASGLGESGAWGEVVSTRMKQAWDWVVLKRESDADTCVGGVCCGGMEGELCVRMKYDI